MYPREIMHCLTHYIPHHIIKVSEHPSQEDRDWALVYLNEKRIKLIKGDLVIFESARDIKNEGVTIFDGEHIIDLDYEDSIFGKIPKIFRVIEDNVPLTYWKDFSGGTSSNNYYVMKDGTLTKHRGDCKRGILIYDCVWFDHNIVRDQCLKNITYGIIHDNKYAIYTTFQFNDQTHYIIMWCTGGFYQGMNMHTYEFTDNTMKERSIKKFHDMLASTELIPFTPDSGYKMPNALYIRFDLNDVLTKINKVPNPKLQGSVPRINPNIHLYMDGPIMREVTVHGHEPIDMSLPFPNGPIMREVTIHGPWNRQWGFHNQGFF